jgi:hypothetical protein
MTSKIAEKYDGKKSDTGCLKKSLPKWGFIGESLSYLHLSSTWKSDNENLQKFFEIKKKFKISEQE